MIEHFCYFLHNLIPACNFNVIASALPVYSSLAMFHLKMKISISLTFFFFFALSTMSGYTIKGNHQQNKNSPH